MAFKSGLISAAVVFSSLGVAPAAFAQDTTVWLAVHENSAYAVAERLAERPAGPTNSQSLDIRFSNATPHCGGAVQGASTQVAFTFGRDARPSDARRFDLPRGWLIASATIPAADAGAYGFEAVELRGERLSYSNGGVDGQAIPISAQSVAESADAALGFVAQGDEVFLGWYQVGLDAEGQAHLAPASVPNGGDLQLPVQMLTQLSQDCS